MGISNTHTAFTIDRACAVLGSTLKAELDEVEGKKKKEIQNKRDRILRRWFPEASSEEGNREPSAARYRDPGRR